MPIILIWNAAAQIQAPTLKRILGDMAYASTLLQKGLTRRFEDAEKAELLTRNYPVFRFTDEAVSAYVTRAQLGMALSGPPEGWGDRFARAGAAWNLPRQWGNRIAEARMLPRLFEVLRQITSAVRGSVGRMQTPKAGMFAEGGVSAIDITGMAALAFRRIGGGRAAIYDRLVMLQNALSSPDPTVRPASAGGAGPPPPELPLEMRIDDWTRYIAGALMLLPAISALALKLGKDVILWIRHEALTAIADIESQVFDMRGKFLTGLAHALNAYAEAGLAFLVTARDYAVSVIDFWARFAGEYLFGLYDGLTVFVDQFSTFWDGVREMIDTLINFGNEILAIDLTQVIHRTLIAVQYLCDFLIHLAYDKEDKPVRYEAPKAFPVTLEQLLLGKDGGETARTQLETGLGRIRDLLAGSIKLNLAGAIGGELGGFDFFGVLRGVDLLGRNLKRPVRDVQAQPVLRYTEENEPDLVALIVRPAHVGLTGIVTDLGNKGNSALQEIGTGLTGMLDAAAAEFDAGADSAARSGLHRSFRKMAEGADIFAAETFPLERRELSNLAPVAQAFATGLAGAFRTMEAAIGGFLGFVLSEWRAHVDQNQDTPVEVNATSPRILLEHARLGRVHMPELVIRVRADQLDQATAQRIAQRFAGEVRAAYARGEERLASWQLAAGEVAL